MPTDPATGSSAADKIHLCNNFIPAGRRTGGTEHLPNPPGLIERATRSSSPSSTPPQQGEDAESRGGRALPPHPEEGISHRKSLSCQGREEPGSLLLTLLRNPASWEPLGQRRLANCAVLDFRGESLSKHHAVQLRGKHLTAHCSDRDKKHPTRLEKTAFAS